MSNVLQPRGPLPARVYWVRRLLLLLVLVTVTTVIWVMVAPSGDGSDGSAAPPDVPAGNGPMQAADTGTDSGRGGSTVGQPADSGTDSEDGSGSTEPGGGTGGSGEGHARGDGDAAEQGQGHRSFGGQEADGKPALAPPTGPCDPADVELDIEVEDAAAGESNTATLRFTSLATPACTLGITPSSVEIRVTSGSDVLWSSTDCPAKLPARQVVARVDPPAAYAFTWSGHRSTHGCGEPGAAAEPGGYWVEASLIGGEPVEAYFDVT